MKYSSLSSSASTGFAGVNPDHKAEATLPVAASRPRQVEWVSVGAVSVGAAFVVGAAVGSLGGFSALDCWRHPATSATPNVARNQRAVWDRMSR